MTTDLYLFPHQDDEFGAFEAMRRSLRAGNSVVAVFLTDGAFYGDANLTRRRNAESREVLESLGVPGDDIHFLGTQANVTDGRLVHDLPRVYGEIATLLAGRSDGIRIFGPAWEGGNHDHDAAHLLARRLAGAFGAGEGALMCFPLYNSAGLPGLLFRLLAPVPGNGPVTRLPISWRDRLWDLKTCLLRYPSQWKFWLALYPPFLLHALFRGWQSLQHPDLTAPVARPHSGRLRYERWFGMPFDEFIAAAGPDFTGAQAPSADVSCLKSGRGQK